MFTVCIFMKSMTTFDAAFIGKSMACDKSVSTTWLFSNLKTVPPQAFIRHLFLKIADTTLDRGDWYTSYDTPQSCAVQQKQLRDFCKCWGEPRFSSFLQFAYVCRSTLVSLLYSKHQLAFHPFTWKEEKITVRGLWRRKERLQFPNCSVSLKSPPFWASKLPSAALQCIHHDFPPLSGLSSFGCRCWLAGGCHSGTKTRHFSMKPPKKFYP